MRRFSLRTTFMILCLLGLNAGWNTCRGQESGTSAASEQADHQLWYGVLDAKVRKFRFLLDITQQAGQQSGKLISYDEGSSEFPLDNLKVTDKSLAFDITASAGHFSGSFDSPDKVTGRWKQRTADLALSFEKVAAPPQPVVKKLWRGEVSSIFQKLPLVVREMENGEVLFDSPKQKATGFVATLKRDGQAVDLEIPGIGAKYIGEISADGQKMTGKWTQGLITIDLDFEKAAATDIGLPTATRRPQTPKPPFDYTVREVSFDNAAAGVRLAGTLTLPKNAAGCPAVVLVSGSGPQDRDESLFEHKPFAVIADHLADHGIACLRFDDRGVGKSTGNFSLATTDDFVSDAQAAVAYLRSVDQINADQIGIAGHSEGGLVAPAVAVADPDVAFVIMLAGPGITGEKILTSQSRLILEAMGRSTDEVQRQAKIQSTFIELAKRQPALDQAAFAAEAMSAIQDQFEDASDKDKSAGTVVRAAAEQLLTPWFRHFLTYDPIPNLRQLKCPVLVLNGSLDLQVASSLNLPPIRQALQTAPTTQFEIHELPQLNHLFQPAKTGLMGEYEEIETTIDPSVLAIVSGWIEQLF